MNNDPNYIDLIDPVDSFSISSVLHPECSVVGVSQNSDFIWFPSIGIFFGLLFSILFDNVLTFPFLNMFVVIRFHLQNLWPERICGGFRHVVRKYYYGKSGRGNPPDIFKNNNLNTCPSWPQTLSFECREVRKGNNQQYSYCPFCVRIYFYRDLGHYVITKCDLIHEGHIVNEASILTHARIESNLTKYEKN